MEGTFLKPLAVKKVRRGTLRVTVGEGKKHEVRLMLEGARLKRIFPCTYKIRVHFPWEHYL